MGTKIGGRGPNERNSAPAPLVALKAARVASGMTQGEAGALIGKTQSHYSKIERGEMEFSASEAAILCRWFRLSIHRLLHTDQPKEDA